MLSPVITQQAKNDLLRLQKENQQLVKKVGRLIADACEHPFTGLGKPEPLKYELAGKWSRCISKQHRMVYEVIAPDFIVISCIGHYE